MDYGRIGAARRQRQLSAKMPKFVHMFYTTFITVTVMAMIAGAVLLSAAGVGVLKGVLASSPEITDKDIRPSGYSSMVYDANGNQITKLVAADSNRIYQTIDKIPLDLQHAFVAIEDERFYTHNGVDLKGIVRAFVTGIKNHDFSQGASTITQQLIKNNVFTSWTKESSFAEKLKRKIQEQFLAVELEKQETVSKESILELYLNTINLGQNTLGVQAASQRYFNKNVSDLNLSEDAVIAAITQNPSRYNPISHPEKNAERRAKVLRNMLNQGYITKAAYEEAINDDVYSRIQTVNEKTQTDTVNSYFVDALTKQVLTDLQEKLGFTETQAYNQLYSGGLSIYATQDPKIQKICDDYTQDEDNYPAGTKYLLGYNLTVEDSKGELQNYSPEMMAFWLADHGYNRDRLFSSVEDAEKAVEEYKASILEEGATFVSERISTVPQPQISLTVADQSTGYVKAIVGGRGKKEGSLTLNRATDTTRQPGSTFKIVSTYAPALDAGGMTLASVQVDEPFAYSNGRPVSNWYSSGYKGICTLRYGIEQSLNIVTVKTLTDITPQLGFDYLLKFGFTTLVDRRVTKDGRVFSDITQTLALGGITDGVKNLELNAAYAAIANGGKYIKPRFYTRILDHDGNVLLDNKEESHEAIKATTAWLLTSAMEDVVTKGTGASVNFGSQPIAGKTGTTSKYNDIWFSGYTPYYTCTTWAGYDNNVDLSTSEQKRMARDIWRGVMEKIHEGLPRKEFTKPSGIVTRTACNKSGKLANGGLCAATGSAYTEYFAEDNVPTETCTYSHVPQYICSVTGLKATAECPYKVPGVTSAEMGYCPHTAENLAASGLTPEAAAAAAAQAAAAQAAATAGAGEESAALPAAPAALDFSMLPVPQP
ncbi:MAG: PBP1A family penicillin-binding protein [Lachnospiraceae bacterium]|nr:PBP1A family penicillin-binding protein [Lachnospiraceae bacterium]